MISSTISQTLLITFLSPSSIPDGRQPPYTFDALGQDEGNVLGLRAHGIKPRLAAQTFLFGYANDDRAFALAMQTIESKFHFAMESLICGRVPIPDQ